MGGVKGIERQLSFFGGRYHPLHSSTLLDSVFEEIVLHFSLLSAFVCHFFLHSIFSSLSSCRSFSLLMERFVLVMLSFLSIRSFLYPDYNTLVYLLSKLYFYNLSYITVAYRYHTRLAF